MNKIEGSSPSFSTFLIRPWKCANPLAGKIALVALSILFGCATLGIVHGVAFIFQTLCCLKNRVKKGVTPPIPPKININNIEQESPIKEESKVKNFASIFPAELWKISIAFENFFYRKNDKKLYFSKNAIDNFKNELLSNTTKLYKDSAQKIEQHKDSSSNCQKLYDYLINRVNQWEKWDGETFMKYVSDNLEIPIDENGSKRKEIESLFFTSTSHLVDLLKAAESDLGITSAFKEYVKDLLSGIRGEKKMSREDLQKGQEICLDYFYSRNLVTTKQGVTGMEEQVYEKFRTIFDYKDIEPLDLALDEEKILDFHYLHNNNASQEEALEFMIKLSNERSTVYRMNDEDHSELVVQSISYCSGSHTVNCTRSNDGKYYLFDNIRENPEKILLDPNKALLTGYMKETGKVSISKALYEKLNMDQIDLKLWKTPKWDKMNCYFSSALMHLAMTDWIESEQKKLTI